MDAQQQNTAKERQLLLETIVFVRSCVASCKRPPVIGADKSKVNANPPEPNEKYKVLLEWAETSTMQLVKNRARKALLHMDASVKNAGSYPENYRKFVNQINRTLAVNKMPDAELTIRLRLKLCEKLNDRRALEKNLTILESMGYWKEANRERQVLRGAAKKTDVVSAGNVKPVVKLTYPAHIKLPQYAKCIDVNKSKLVAARNLFAGDVIALEETHCWIVYYTCRFERCDWCLKDDPLCLLACPGCQLVMYCSPECRKQALLAYHTMECGVVQWLPQKEPEEWMFPTLRSVCMTFGVFRYKFASLRKFFEHARKETVVPLHQRDWGNMNSQQIFCAKMGQAMGQTKRTRIRNLPLALSVELMTRAVATHFDDQSLSNADEEFLQEFIEWHLQQSRKFLLANKIMLFEKSDTNTNVDPKVVSFGWYPLLKQFPPCSNKPFCTPNVELLDVAPKTKAAIVLRSVAKGQPLTVRSAEDSCRCSTCEYQVMWSLNNDDFYQQASRADELQQCKEQMNNCGVVKPPYSDEFLHAQVQLLRCLRCYYMEMQGP